MFGTPHPEGYYFGNLPIVLAGDFMQLPPVASKPIFETEACLEIGDLHLYRSLFHPVFLIHSQRQAGQDEFFKMLNAVRLADSMNSLSEKHQQLLNSLRVNSEEVIEQDPDFEDAVWIYAKRKQVHEHNQAKLEHLARTSHAPIYYIPATDKMNDTPLVDDELRKKLANTKEDEPADSSHSFR